MTSNLVPTMIYNQHLKIIRNFFVGVADQLLAQDEN